MTFLSTLSLRRATPPFLVLCTAKKFLSTLSLRRATFVVVAFGHVHGIISIHALLAESDGQYPVTAMMCKIFLSTLSLRRATSGHLHTGALHKVFLSTLSLRRATKICKYVARRNVISIHALLAESDIYCHLSGASYSISIHALLAESDGPWSTLPIGMANFYPRSPCGERLVVDGHRVHITRFLSTLSLRRATIILRYSVSLSVFSIHALLAESDQ